MVHQVICFGEILWDCFKDGKKAGGAPMNVALHLYKQGLNSALISAVGADENGQELLRFLKKEGLDIQDIQKNLLPTGIVDVHLDEENQATYTIVKPVAWDQIEYRPEFDQLAEQAEAIVFGSLACRSAKSRETLLKLIEKVSLRIFDMNLRPPHFEKSILETLLHQADILKINEHELDYLANLYDFESPYQQGLLPHLSERFSLKMIIITLGDEGARVWHDGQIFTHPGYKVKVADTVGAGDAFLATFISGLLHNYPMQQILTRSCAAGALVASHSGANPDYTIADIFKICNI
jgi:fructokinase